MDENLEWVTVRYQGVDYNRYKISEYGTVWDLKLGKEAPASVNKTGDATYVNVLPDDGDRSGRRRIRVINILCNSFNGDAPSKKCKPYVNGEIHKSQVYWKTGTSNQSDEHFIYEGGNTFRCRKCDTLYKGCKLKGKCPCDEIPDGIPCAVYVLVEDNGVGLKIGKALNPFSRQYKINLSANKVGYSFPQVDKVIWVNGENCALTLEKVLQRF